MLKDMQPVEMKESSMRGRSSSILASSINALNIIADDFPEAEEEEESTTFSFGDFAVNAEDDASVSYYEPDEESANAEQFMFGDFSVPAVESSRKNKKKKTFKREMIARVVSVTPIIGHNARVKCIAARDALVASCSAMENYVTMRAQGSMVQLYSGHEDIITSICFSFTGKHMATTSKDGTCRLWDIETARCSGIFPHPKVVTACSFSQNGKYLVTGCQDAGCRLWATRNAKQNIPVPVVSYFGHNSVITSIDFQTFGDSIISGSTDKTAKMWAAGTGNTILSLPHDSTVLSVRFGPDGKTAYVVTVHKVTVVDAATAKVKCSLTIDSVNTVKTGGGSSDSPYFIYVSSMPHSVPDHFCVSMSDNSVRVFRCDAQGMKEGKDGCMEPTEVVSFDFREKVLCLTPVFNAPTPSNATAKLRTKSAKDNVASIVCGDLNGNLYQLGFAVQR
jgi:WD40 repeat protein